MKKTLSLVVFLIIILTVLCTTSIAADSFVKDNDFTIASYNGVNTFVGKGEKINELEDSVYWLTDNIGTYNIKYVSFIGNIANTCEDTYAEIVYNQKKTTAELITISLANENWHQQYKNFYSAIKLIPESGIPVGISPDRNDYVSSGYSRDTLVSQHLGLEAIMPDGANFDTFDERNYVTYIQNNGVNYMIFQLEVFPRTSVLNWFNETIAKNEDKYAIIYTTSFLDTTGEMYTMWDWGTTGFNNSGTTDLKSCNLTWIGNPRDGEEMWKYSFNNYDNILAIVSSKGEGSTKIATKKLTNKNGYNVAAAYANADNGMNALTPTILLTKISEDNKEITFAWVPAFGEVDESSIQTVKLNNIVTLKESLVNTNLPKVALQSNGSNKAYIFGYEGNTFRPNANMTRAEACTIFARLILGTQTIPDGYTTRFEDVKKGDWFYNAVAYLDETGYFFRNKNTTYKPNEPITRAEFVDLANSASKLQGNSKASFTDVPEDHFYYIAIMAAAQSGLVNGYEDNTFRPDNTITRAEVVTVINRLLGLKATDTTIDTNHIKNEFVDIASHWGRLNILMASNSNVHSTTYYTAKLDGVSDKGNDIVFANKHFSFSVNKKSGNVTNITNLCNGEDITHKSTTTQFVYLTSTSNAKVLPTGFTIENNSIKITFKNGAVVYMFADIKDNYMTFELETALPSNVLKVNFVNLTTSLPTAVDDDDFMLNGIGMSYWTNPVNKGYRSDATSTTAFASPIYARGTSGAKMGIVFSKKSDAISFLQELTDAIDPSVGLTSKSGGAYAKEWEGNYGDYALVSDVNPETIDENIKLALELGIDQYDIHQGGATVRQGDFRFAYTENGTAEEYYQNVGKKIADAGIETGLHTYAYYISNSASGILSDPKWQKDLETLETYTLRKKITKFTVNIATVEDATNFDLTNTFFYKNSQFVLIDNEIIRITKGTDQGFINCIRGQCGTEATTHLAGAKIYHLSGYFYMFVPKLGSELFYHVADLTAKAYNEGGFDMIYLDAIDGLKNHLPEGHETWYYFHEFVHRIVSQCERTPIVETSASAPSEWNIRGRTGALDTCNRGIKLFINNHINKNLESMSNNMTTTLGWFDFFPDRSPVAGIKNTIQKTIFHDDLDALGMGALLYDMSVVYNPFSVSSITDNPFHYDNVLYYKNNYTNLRKSHYFSDEAIERVKAIGGEWKVIEKGEGEYAFLQMYYNAKNIVTTNEYSENTLNGNNPFDAQMPFIRIESRYSTLFENPVTLAKFDENAPIGSSLITKNFTGIDMTQNMAMGIRVKGTGNDGDALLITLQGGISSGESGGTADYFIDLNFEGWRDIILIDMDNAGYDVEKYKFPDRVTTTTDYGIFRVVANFESVEKVQVRQYGATAKNAQLGNLVAYTHTPAEIKNPTIKIGSSSLTFNCEMKGGEYLEYDPLTGKAILYHNAEQTKEEITFTGKLHVGSGTFNAVYTAEGLTSAPVRARVVLGFSGQEITN